MPKINISELNIKITGSFKGLATAVVGANSVLSRFGANTQKNAEHAKDSFREFEKILARTLALYATFKAIDFAKTQLFDSVRLAADAEQAEIAFEVLLGSAEDAQKTISDLYRFVERTPFRLEEVRDSAQALAAYGFEAEELIPTLRLGDIASGNTSVGLQELANLYGRTRVENRLYTRDLRQFTTRGILLADELAKILGRTTTEITQMAEEGTLFFSDMEVALKSLTGEGGRFFRLTERQAKTTKGEYSNLLDEVDSLKREFGNGLLPALKDTVAVMREVVTGGGDVTSRMDEMRRSGQAVADIFRGLAVVFQGVRLVLIRFDLGITAVINKLANLIGQKGLAQATAIAAEDLARQFNEVSDSFNRLRNFDLSLREAFGFKARSDQGLSEQLDTIAGDAFRAKKELEELTKTAEGFAKSLEEKYADPIDKFRREIQKIVQAQQLGGLAGNVAINAMNAQIQALIESVEAAKRKIKELTTVGAIDRGSQEDIAARFQQAFNPFSEAAFQKQAQLLQLKARQIIREIQFAEESKADDLRFRANQVPKDKSRSPDNKTAAILDKMRKESRSMAVQDRTILRRIAVATEREANREPIRVRTLSA